MKRVWTIRLYEVKGGYKAVIEGEGGYSEGKSKSAYGAYAYAESKLVIKPGFIERAERPTAEEKP